MSSRNYHPAPLSNLTRAAAYSFVLQGAGAAAPTFVEGDVSGATAGTFATSARTGVGVYTLKTADPFPGLAGCNVQAMFNSPGAGFTAQIKASQNSDYTWTFTISVFNATAALELSASDQLSVELVFRNGLNQP